MPGSRLRSSVLVAILVVVVVVVFIGRLVRLLVQLLPMAFKLFHLPFQFLHFTLQDFTMFAQGLQLFLGTFLHLIASLPSFVGQGPARFSSASARIFGGAHGFLLGMLFDLVYVLLIELLFGIFHLPPGLFILLFCLFGLLS